MSNFMKMTVQSPCRHYSYIMQWTSTTIRQLPVHIKTIFSKPAINNKQIFRKLKKKRVKKQQQMRCQSSHANDQFLSPKSAKNLCFLLLFHFITQVHCLWVPTEHLTNDLYPVYLTVNKMSQMLADLLSESVTYSQQIVQQVNIERKCCHQFTKYIELLLQLKCPVSMSF